jgi:hypothetical protein
MPVFRRMGFRTQTEIDQEKYALKALRGDFSQLSDSSSRSDDAAARDVMEAVRR